MVHALERLSQRYKLELTPYDLSCIARQIEAGQDAIEVRKGDNGSSIWDVRFQGEILRVVYCFDGLQGWVKTALPSSDGSQKDRKENCYQKVEKWGRKARLQYREKMRLLDEKDMAWS